MIDKILALKNAIDEAEKIWLCGKDGQITYRLIFSHKGEVIDPLLNELGIRVDWYDPDTSYEQDTAAYMIALVKLRDKKLPRVWTEEDDCGD